MDPRVADEVSITDLFDQFIEASTMRNVLSIHHRILNYSDLNPCEFNVFFPKLKRAVMTNRVRKNWKAKALFSKIDKKAAHRCYSNTKASTPLGNRSGDNDQNNSHNSQECLDDSITSQSNRIYYNNNALQNYNCLVIGSGPAGLRTAIELQLLGASRVVVVEKRSRFSRNNVLHLWPFVIDDLKSLGAKKFYGKFCAGSIDHISIRQLQLILLKISLMIGCDFRDSCSYLYLCPSSIKQNQQVTNGNNSDNKKVANGSSDSTESITLKCDLDVVEPSKSNNNINNNNFVKVSQSIANETEIELKQEEETKTNNGLVSSNKLESDEQEDRSLSNQIQHNQDAANDNSQARPDEPGNTHDDPNVIVVPSDEKRLSKTPLIVRPAENQATGRRGENLLGARAHFQSDYQFQEKELHSYEWDVIIGADGRRNTLSKFFPRKEFRGRLAIAITANFINRQTPAEASVSEISGLSFIYNQDMFNALAYDTNIQLENICYYKDDTHYFVMTAKKKSLLERGVLINDYPATQDLLSDDNVDRQALFNYAKDAAYWTTGLDPLDFALNHYGQEDCAMFDFTSMYAASNACKALRTKEGGLTLVSLVGDSLLEPFWPTGSGCARGFLSSFDAAWMCRQWAVNKCAVVDYHNSISSRASRNRSSTAGEEDKIVELTTYNRMALSVMAERESIYRILAQTTSENLQQNYSHWTLNPHSRYPNLNRHLVTPSQVEHLITDNDNAKTVSAVVTDKNKSTTTLASRRTNKSPNNASSRKSPKKLKSANASPLAQPKNYKGRARSLSKQAWKSRSRHDDLALDDTYLEFEESYNNLADCEKGPTQYLNHRPPDCDVFDDFFIPSISGTLPSSNNLLSLEQRRARDIDECLRQRRQKTQLNVVRDQLLGQLRGEMNSNRQDSQTGNSVLPCGAALFNELRRLREQQSKGKENKTKDVNGPLTLLNSIRRCASFAERVKSFESKLGSSGGSQDSSVVTPKTPIDNVKNLPQFATLHELFVNNSALNKDNESVKKSKMPIMKLSKDDWNVRCWEKRLAAYKQKNGKELCGSTKSLNKATSVDSYRSHASGKPERQVEVFKDRIKEMADKLKKARDHNQKLYGESEKCLGPAAQQENSYPKSNSRSQGWVSHLRRELIKGVEAKRPQNAVVKQAMNPSVPNKPIKKLFEEDDDEDDDINKHYDHLCVNRPTNKYLPKSGYTSHLTRIKYNSATSKVINRQPSIASKQSYMATLTSRGSSASSTQSDYSTNTGGSSSGGVKQQQIEVKCFRCKAIVSCADKITIGDSALHRSCLTCANCGITLRTNEIQHYLNLIKDTSEESQGSNFVCAICKPNIRADLTREAVDRLAQAEIKWSPTTDDGADFAQRRLRSREDFLNERINYNELYKNILTHDRSKEAADKIERLGSSSSRDTTSTINNSDAQIVSKKSCSSQDYEDAKSMQDSQSLADTQKQVNISPSPIQVTLPLKLVTGRTHSVEDSSEHEVKAVHGYRIARSETIDGSEQVTLRLPSVTDSASQESATLDERTDNAKSSRPREMIDEEELQRILHLDNSAAINQSSTTSTSSSTTRRRAHNNQKSGESSSSSSESAANDKDEHGDDTSDENRDDEDPRAVELSDDPSSLNSPPNTEDYDDIDENIDQNSTYEDFLTSEEFGVASDREDAASLEDSNDEPHKVSVSGE